MIVKDGGEKLRRCLDSVQGIVDEIVIVDTGSTDDSISIARSFGVRIKEVPWPGAFGMARNLALDEVETEWTLVLDADEWLHEEFRSGFRALMDNESAAGFYLRRFDVEASGGYGETYFLRLFRTHPLVRYDAVIHEQIHAADIIEKTGRPEVPVSEVTVWHDGYASQPTREKIERDVALLKEQLDRTPNDLYFQATLLAALQRLGSLEARGWLRALIEHCLEHEAETEPESQELSLPICIYLDTVSPLDAGTKRTQRIIELGWKWFGSSPYVMTAIAELESRRGNLLGALRAAVRLAEMAETGSYSRQRAVPSAMLGEVVWLRLSVLARHAGQKELAVRACRMLLELSPNHPGALEELKLLGVTP